jgi:hypothetical protein
MEKKAVALLGGGRGASGNEPFRLGAEVQAVKPAPVYLFQWELNTGRIVAQPRRTQAFVNEVPARLREIGWARIIGIFQRSTSPARCQEFS